MDIYRKVFLLLFIGFLTFRAYDVLQVSAPKLTTEQSQEIAIPYFNENYGLEVSVEYVNYREVREDIYYNFIKVSDGTNEYELALDRNNVPEIDNVNEVRLIQNIDTQEIKDALREIGVEDDAEYHHFVTLHFDTEYLISFTFSTKNIKQISGDAIYEFFSLLKNKNVDYVELIVFPPELFESNTAIAWKSFPTNIRYRDFKKLYTEVFDSFQYNQLDFEKSIEELLDLGYKNIAFGLIYDVFYGAKITLHCESTQNLSCEKAADILNNLDETSFKVKDENTVFILDHKYIDEVY